MKAWYLAFAACLIGAKAWGHHSFAAVYLEEQEVTIEGPLVQFLWRNPHTLVHVMVEQDDGTKDMPCTPSAGGWHLRVESAQMANGSTGKLT